MGNGEKEGTGACGPSKGRLEGRVAESESIHASVAYYPDFSLFLLDVLWFIVVPTIWTHSRRARGMYRNEHSANGA